MNAVSQEKQMIMRTKSFGLRIIKLVSSLPAGQVGSVIAKQLLRSGTSVGANYRAACRGRSLDEFIAKLGIVEEEADECIYWMELLVEAGLIPDRQMSAILKEANELLAITVASRKTARNRNSQFKNRN